MGSGKPDPGFYMGGGDMSDLAAALMKRGVNSITDEELCGNEIGVVKCRACSGYGACGYKTFYLYNAKPYSVCNLRLKKVQSGEKTPEQLEMEGEPNDVG